MMLGATFASRQTGKAPPTVIPFYRPWIGVEERRAVDEALQAGSLAGNGPATQAVEAQLTSLVGVQHAVLMSSCTAAFQTALAVLDINGGEVVLPSFAFPSAAAAIVAAGACPVFVDIEPASLGMDPDGLRQAVSLQTRAVLYVDYGGFPGTLEAIGDETRRLGIPLIEDAAHALGSSSQGRPLGGWGRIGCVSFHETKLVTCGEGGALLTNDERLAQTARRYREYGTNRAEFFRGAVDHYEWVGPGASFLLAEPLAALLERQLRRLPEMLARQRALAERYLDAFASLERAGLIALLRPPSDAEVNWHVFALLLRDASTAQDLLRALARQGIDARRHFYPLHQSAYAKSRGFAKRPLTVTESVATRLIRLPMYPALTAAQQERVLRAVEVWAGRRAVCVAS